MAKITGPLMSLSASGTVGKIAAFRATKGGSVCAMKPDRYAQNTQAMLVNQQRMKDARASFSNLSTEDLGYWKLAAEYKNMEVWPFFFAEYNFQYVQAPDAPLIPSPDMR